MAYLHFQDFIIEMLRLQHCTLLSPGKNYRVTIYLASRKYATKGLEGRNVDPNFQFKF